MCGFWLIPVIHVPVSQTVSIVDRNRVPNISKFSVATACSRFSCHVSDYAGLVDDIFENGSGIPTFSELSAVNTNWFN